MSDTPEFGTYANDGFEEATVEVPWELPWVQSRTIPYEDAMKASVYLSALPHIPWYERFRRPDYWYETEMMKPGWGEWRPVKVKATPIRNRWGRLMGLRIDWATAEQIDL